MDKRIVKYITSTNVCIWPAVRAHPSETIIDPVLSPISPTSRLETCESANSSIVIMMIDHREKIVVVAIVRDVSICPLGK
jgi:hypothetical protein